MARVFVLIMNLKRRCPVSAWGLALLPRVMRPFLAVLLAVAFLATRGLAAGGRAAFLAVALRVPVVLEAAGLSGPEGNAGVEIMGMPPTMTSSATYTYAPSSTASWSTSGEKVVPVVGAIVIADAQTAGAFHWWVEYCFDANIVWTQADLA